MTVEAPTHRERGRLPHQRHVRDIAVAAAAADAFGDMDRVVEVDVVGQPMHACPVQRLMLGQARAHWRQHRGIGEELRMTGHAGGGRRHAGESRCLDRGVAIATIDAEAADVMRVAERHRLMPGDRLVGRVRRHHQRISAANQREGRNQNRNQHNARDRVGNRSEKLWHEPRRPQAPASNTEVPAQVPRPGGPSPAATKLHSRWLRRTSDPDGAPGARSRLRRA